MLRPHLPRIPNQPGRAAPEAREYLLFLFLPQAPHSFHQRGNTDLSGTVKRIIKQEFRNGTDLLLLSLPFIDYTVWTSCFTSPSLSFISLWNGDKNRNNLKVLWGWAVMGLVGYLDHGRHLVETANTIQKWGMTWKEVSVCKTDYMAPFLKKISGFFF